MALRVTGESMIGAGILDGDLVIIRRQTAVDDGEIAAVEVDGEVTLKRWNGPAVLDGSVRLIPANPALRPIEIAAADGKDVRVLGKYVGLVRGARL
jgi:repressor LexA